MLKKELENKELYEVELPIELPKIKLNLVHLKGELTKVDKKFIKEYLKKINHRIIFREYPSNRVFFIK